MPTNEKKKDPQEVIFARVEEFKANFAAESDRACVVLVAARLDALLHQALSAHLLPPPTRDDNLLDSDRALGTFSARIDVCYRLGMIDAEYCRALHLLRRIRNEFAHEASDSSLEKSPHRERIMQLAAPIAHLEAFEILLKTDYSEQSHCRGIFCMCSYLLVLRLEKVVFTTRRLEGDPIQFVPTGWKKNASVKSTAADKSPDAK